MGKKKFVNEIETITDEMLEGLEFLLGDFVEVRGHVIVKKGLLNAEPKVNTVIIGGSGHEPGGLAFAEKGWENVRVVGDVFAAPGPATVLEGIKTADMGKGVLVYVSNHAGDIMSARVAIKMAKKEGIQVDLLVFGDDCSSYSREEKDQRRGMCCSLVLGKLLSSASEKGLPLARVKEIGERYVDNVATLAVANRGATHPVTNLTISDIPDGEMIIGMGQHGEGANVSIPLISSRDTVDRMASKIADDLQLKAGDDVIVTISGSGSTTFMELLIVFKDTVNFLKQREINVVGKLVGEYLTSQEQGGFQMSIGRVDSELLELFRTPCKLYG